MDDNEYLALAAAIFGAMIGAVLGVIVVILFFGGLPK